MWQPNEPIPRTVEFSPRSTYPGSFEGQGGTRRALVEGHRFDFLDEPYKRKVAGTAKVLRQPLIEEPDEQVVYPRLTPSERNGMRTRVPKPLIGKEKTINTHRIHQYFSDHIPSSSPESYLHPRATRRGRFGIVDRPASARPIRLLKSPSPILRPQCPSPPDENAPSRLWRTGPVFLIPHKVEKPLSVGGLETENKRTIPGVADLTGRITRLNDYPSAHGGFADVWTGYWHADSGLRKVAIKVLHSQSGDEEGKKKKLNKKLRRELRVWERLRHENVLPLLGVTSNFGPYTSMVCPWMENGTLHSYLVNTGNSLRLSDRFRILREVAAGLSYLHSFDVIHGDLTGSNVLIGDKGQVMLSDFGLSTVIAEFQGTSYFTSSLRGAVRWAAREIYVINEGDPIPAVSTHSDIYSFGSVMLQTLTNKVPYHYLRLDEHVLLQLDKGVYPRRPLEAWVTDDLWTFINRCWVKDPPNRPTIREVLAFIDFHYYACSWT